MVVGTVEFPAREHLGQPGEERPMADVHAEGDLRLTAVTAKGSLPHQDPDQQADLELAEFRSCFTVSYHVKHRSCFTVSCHVKQRSPVHWSP